MVVGVRAGEAADRVVVGGWLAHEACRGGPPSYSIQYLVIKLSFNVV